ncbi:thioesterase II family protein [Bacillus pacificus]|uniref:thioesterase II family protein n=1 Tax=Bacillus pacificus TaxID=2026187 RepID=UPI000B4C0701|nr:MULTISPECIES: thioesterase domain-containing protein [Bacillus cereus group]MDQ7236350.1 thioesterase domain-containing protein [Bacillus pacificus]MDQ7237963.1 thioesterase domain-containing protein [Bacillus pacificus]NRR15839.1 thioesterase [Bacillus pacificus]
MQKTKLFCFPHAGGSAFNYAKWKNYFNPYIEVVPIELAGRGYRIEESLYQGMEEAVNDAYTSIVKQIDASPYILFGHSMGSLIAYEVARKIQDSNNELPKFLVLSGRNHPNSKIKNIRHNLSNEQFKREVIAMGGTPSGVLQSEELMEIFLPILRADFKIVETYIHDNNIKPCDIDFLIFNGKNDEFTTYDQVIKWNKYTNKTCTFHSFEGNHFFLNENIEEIAKSIIGKLNSKRLSTSF